MSEKNEGEMLKEKLFNKKENGWLKVSSKEDIFNYAKGYINFMNRAKTEREIVKESKKIAESNGFKDINECQTLKPGDKIYFVNNSFKLICHNRLHYIVHGIYSESL